MSDERPQHSVSVSTFYIGKYEVTEGLWRAVLGSDNYQLRLAWRDANRPVTLVRWIDAQEFIAKLNTMTGKKYRLPTEAEWEYAARGGQSSKGYKFSGSNTMSDVAWYGSSTTNRQPVGTKAPNELGIYDMNGNVWELCSDWYGPYPSSFQANPTGPSTGSHHVIRGGCCASLGMELYIYRRSANHPDTYHATLGLRLACDPE